MQILNLQATTYTKNIRAKDIIGTELAAKFFCLA